MWISLNSPLVHATLGKTLSHLTWKHSMTGRAEWCAHLTCPVSHHTRLEHVTHDWLALYLSLLPNVRVSFLNFWVFFRKHVRIVGSSLALHTAFSRLQLSYTYTLKV